MGGHGERLYRKIARIEADRGEHRKAGDKNHLAIGVLEFKKEKTVQVLDVALTALMLDEARLDNAGKKGAEEKKAKAQAKNEKLLPYIERCMKHLNTKGGASTAKAIGGAWAKLGLTAESGVECPTDRKINALKKLILSRP